MPGPTASSSAAPASPARLTAHAPRQCVVPHVRQVSMLSAPAREHTSAMRASSSGTTGASGQESEAQRRLAARGVIPVYVPIAAVWHYLHRNFLEVPWVLGRAYRHALEWGIRRTRGQKASTLAIARAALGRLNAQAKAAALRLLGGEERQFAAAFHEVKWRGRWDGLWLGIRWDEQPQFRMPAANDSPARAA